MLIFMHNMPSYIRNISTTLVIIISSHFVSHSQLRVDKVIPPSFNAVALIKYCDHPTGTNYGIPEINFPINTLINDDIEIPIVLSYHSIGVKVEEESTWTGLGWYLNAGGLITRIIRGENDFGVSENDEGDENELAKGYPFEHIKPCFDDCDENENAEFHQKVCAGEIDSDPDIFFFNILGAKGKFLLTPDHDPKKEFISINIVSPKKMTIKFFIKKNYWTATEENGFEYTFKVREITETFDNYFDYKFDSHKLHFLSHFNKATTSWYLSEVKSPKGATAKFYYDTDPDGRSGFTSNSAYHRMNINDADVWDLHYSSYCFPDDIENLQIVSENQHNDIYLSSIICGDYTATFNKSVQENMFYSKDNNSDEARRKYRPDTFRPLGPQKLDKIQIFKNGKSIGTNTFFYSYFNGDVKDGNTALYLRLKLDRLTTKNEEVENIYKFNYEENIALPSKESHARDLWGHYNGEEDIHNITPSDFYNYSQPEKLLQEDSKTKHYSLDYIKSGILTSINYNNGKTVEYQYDHQEFETVDEEISGHFTANMKNSNFSHHMNPFIFGGLRIQKIIDRFPTEKITREFNYKPNGTETGKLIITHYNHDHHGFGHKTSGNHCVKYGDVDVTMEKETF